MKISPVAAAVLVAVTLVPAVGITAAGEQAVASSPGTVHLPDLVAMEPFPSYAVQSCVSRAGAYYGNPCSYQDGTLFLSSGTAPANLGDGPLELRSEINPQDKTTSIAYQRFYTYDDRNRLQYVSETPIGVFEYHPTHRHYHFSGYSEVQLREALCSTSDPSCVGQVLSTTEKIGFCLVDIGKTDATLEHFARRAVYGEGSCSRRNSKQGISVGWFDIYSWNLPDQTVEVPSGLAYGNYWLTLRVDAESRLQETDETNNDSRVLLEYEPGDPSDPNLAGGVRALCKVSPISSVSDLASNSWYFAPPCSTA